MMVVKMFIPKCGSGPFRRSLDTPYLPLKMISTMTQKRNVSELFYIHITAFITSSIHYITVMLRNLPHDWGHDLKSLATLV